MRCRICDKILQEPRFNSDHDEYEPCEACLIAIQDTLDSYLDQPYAAEDELGYEPILEAYGAKRRNTVEDGYLPSYLEDE